MAFTVTSVTGSVNNSHYDIYKSSWSGSNACAVSLYNISKVKVKYTKPSGTSLGRKVTSIDLLVGGSVYKTLTCWGGSWWGATCNYLAFQDGDEYELDFRNEGHYFGGNPYGGSDVGSPNTVRFTSSGSKKVQIRLNYKLDSSFDYNDTVTANGSQTIDLGQNVIIDDVVLNSISVSGGTRSFYKNATLDFDGLVVTAYYNYVNSTITGSAGSQQATSETVTASASKMAYIYSSNGYTPRNEGDELDYSGTWTASFSYSHAGRSRSATYSITVYGVSTAPEPSLNTYYKKGSAEPSLSVTVTYEDGTTKDEDVSMWYWNNGAVGTREIYYFYYASKTGDLIDFRKNVTFSDYSLSATYSGASHFDYNNKNVKKADLVVKKVWENSLGEETISSDNYSLSYGDWDVGEATGEIIITDGENKTTSFTVNVDGPSELVLSVASGSNLFGKGTQFTTSGVSAFATRYSDGSSSTDDTAIDSARLVITPNSISTDDTGDQTITVSYTDKGKTVSATYDITVYEHTELVLTNNTTEKWIVDGEIYGSEFTTGLKVTAKCSNDVADNTSPYYDISPATNDELVEGDNTITVTSYYDANKTVVGTTTTYTVKVAEDYPTEDATISVTDSRTQQEKIILINNTASLEHITVKVSETNAGLTNVSFDDYDVQLVLHSDNTVTKTKNDLTFNSGDTLGYYDMVISIDGVTDTETIENAVCFKGLSSVSYDESRESNGYFVNATTKVSNSNRVKVGDTLNKAWIKFRKHYSDNTYEDVFDSSFVSSIKANSTERTKVMYADNDDEVSNYIPYSVTINGSTFTMNVPFIYVSSLSLTNTKTAYDIHDQLDTSKITLKKVYSNSTEENLTINDVSVSFTGAGTGCKVSDLIPEDTRMSASVTLSFAYTEGDAPQVTATSGITVKAIRSVALRDENQNTVSKITYEYGETHSLTGYYLYVIFNTDVVGSPDRETIVINNKSDYANKGDIIATDTAIPSSVGYTYPIGEGKRGDTVTTSLTIHCHYLDDISVDFSSVTANTLYQYETLDVSEITATATIESTDSDDTSYPKTEDITDDLSFTFNGQNVFVDTGYYLGSVGTFNLIATYNLNGQIITKTQALTIVAVVLQSITLTKAAGFKALSDYYEEQHLDLSGLTINVIYNRTASNHTISYTDQAVTIVDTDGHTISKTKEIDLEDDELELIVKYTENGTSVYSPALPDEGALGELSVTPKALDSIRIRQAPTKTQYYYGDTFSLSGIVVEAVFNNGASEIISNASLVLSGMSSGHVFNKTDDGTTFEDKSATLSYTHGGVTKTTTLTYTLLKPVLASIRHNVDDVSEPVQKRFTDTDTFTSSGLVVKAIFTNGYEETLTNNDFSLNTSALYLDTNGKIQLNANNQDYGSKSVGITGVNPYDANDSKTTSYSVEVTTSGAVRTAVLKLKDDYNRYFVGEEFTAKGVSFTVTDVDGVVFESTEFLVSIDRGTIFRSAQRLTITVQYVKGTYIGAKETFEILVSIPNKVENTDTNNYRLAIGYLVIENGELVNKLFDKLLDEDGNEISFGKQYDQYGNLTGERYPLFHEDKVSVDNDPYHVGSTHEGVYYENTYGYNIYTGDTPETDMIGYIDLGIEDVRNAHIVLFDDPVNPIDGDGNIEVTFPHYVSGYADRINNCHFGKVFHNRLFVAGNPDYKSADFHSGDINIGQIRRGYDLNTKGDYSYFSDLDYCYYGNEETAIVGYDEYRDGDLIVIKEGSKNQATLYRREYKLVEATDYAGNEVGEGLYEEAFPMFDINSNGGVGGLSHRSITNFVGETLVLTRNGLKAITNKESVFNNAKYTFDVSTYINPKITHEELEKSILFAYDEKLLLKTNRGVYVGYYEIRNDNGEYEWYFLDNINADIFFECDNELFFANDTGDVCRFSIELLKYKDQERTFVGVGGTLLTIDESNDSLVVSATYASKVKEGNPFHVITNRSVSGIDQKSLIHASLGLFVDTVYRSNMIGNNLFDQTAYVGLVDRDNNHIIIKPYTSDGVVDTDRLNIVKNLFFTGRKVYFDNFTGSGVYSLNKYQEYELKKVDTGDDRDNVYELYDEWGDRADLSGIATIRMSIIVNDLSITKITDVSDYGSSGAKKFKLIGDHDQILDLINYDSQSYTYAGVITNEDKVKAYYETAPYAMGSIVSLKTIWSWTIVNDTALAGYMDIGYFASRKQGDYNYSVRSVPDSKGYDFSHYSWRTLDFTSRKLPATYSIQRTVPSIAYIRYLFKNFEETNIVLTSLNVVYTISNLLKGVK